MMPERDRGARNNDGSAMVATHGVKRDADLIGHRNPGGDPSGR
jgi:hypothetical protein